MKFTVLQENIQKSLSIVARIATSSGQLAILNTVKIKAGSKGLSLSCTNLELSINYWVGVKVEQEGEVVVPIKQLLELISSFPTKKLVFSKKDKQLQVACDGVKISVNTMTAEEFPKIPGVKELKKSKKVLLDQKILSDAISKVAFSASIDESRAVLTGVMLINTKKGLRMVATDGYRLSFYQLDKKVDFLSDGKGIIIPARTLSELLRVLSSNEDELSLSLDQKQNQAVFTFSNGELFTRLIEGEFPDYEKIIPEENVIKIDLDKDSFARAVKLAAIFAREAANIVRLKLEKGKLTVEANAAELGQGSTQIEVNYQGESLQIAFNFRFLNEMIANINGEQVELNFSDSLKPGLFLEKGNKNYLHLIMPVRVQSQ